MYTSSSTSSSSGDIIQPQLPWVQYSTEQYNTVQYSTLQYSAVQTDLDAAGVVSGEEEVALDVECDAVDVVAVSSQLLKDK